MRICGAWWHLHSAGTNRERAALDATTGSDTTERSIYDAGDRRRGGRGAALSNLHCGRDVEADRPQPSLGGTTTLERICGTRATGISAVTAGEATRVGAAGAGRRKSIMMARWILLAAVLYSALGTRYSVRGAADAPVTTSTGPQQLSGPLEILEKFDIGPSQIESFFSGQPLSAGEEDVLVKILYHFPRLGLDNLQRWREKSVTWEHVAAAPVDHRMQVFRLAGRVKHLEAVRLLPEQAELYEFDHYYRARIALADSPHEVLVAARRIPDAWSLDMALDEPTAADAIFLKTGDTTDQRQQLIFVADRLGWYPDRPEETHHVGPPQLALAKLGMDISLWDEIRKSKERALGSGDREGFYQLLVALGKPAAGELVAHTKHLDLVSLLEKSEDHFGEISAVQGLARRVMKVPVSDADIRSRFGIDHYYEIDLFVPLGDASLRFGQDPTGENNPVYRNKFPATLIVRDLPPGFPQGENVHELVAADAVFFKVWNYRSSYTSKFGQLQPAPLFIASTAHVVTTGAGGNWITSALVLVAFALGISVIVVIAWMYGRDDRRSESNARRRAESSPPPDFSRLT